MHILVAATRQIDQDDFIFGQSCSKLGGIGQSMARLQCRDDAFDAAAMMECLDRLVIGNRHVLRASAILQPCMLGADTGIIESGGHRMRFDDLTICILQQVGTISMQYAR